MAQNKIMNANSLPPATPLIMAILNYTSDSFYDGGYYHTPDKFFARAQQCVLDGAHILDIGVASSRPGAPLIDPKKEWELIHPLLIEIKKLFPDVLISIDTYNSYTAEKCIENGADIINDISGGTFDNKMYDVVATSHVYYVLMHTSDIPEKMQSKTNYNNVISDIQSLIKEKINFLHQKGCSNIIIDPGFGFGKTIQQNYEILKNLDAFQLLHKPLMVGISRKSMIYKTLNVTPDHNDTLFGTVILNTIAILKGAKILRVHDVKETKILAKVLYPLFFM